MTAANTRPSVLLRQTHSDLTSRSTLGSYDHSTPPGVHQHPPTSDKHWLYLDAEVDFL